ncbi:MAG: hypothetical protein O3B13_26010, partial [Planctomycetota bacterium]|nr:hypothetical protein [Planctomycetota bacterium]
MFWFCLVTGCDSTNPATPAPHEDETAASVEVIPEPLYIRLTGTEHRWSSRYPAMTGSTSHNDRLQGGRDLHVPVDTTVVLVLSSTDYIYTLAIPEYGVKEIAVPNLEFRMEFRPMQCGQFELIG